MTPHSMPESFSFQERLGIYFGVQSACLSAAAVVVLLLYTLVRLWRQRKTESRESSDATGSSLFWNLMISDLLQAIGCLPSIRWMLDGMVTEGSLCTAQGVLKQIGTDGAALSSLCIAIHTFTVLILRRRTPFYAPKCAVLLIWLFIAFVVGTPHAFYRTGRYYGETGYWCWISKDRTAARILSQYLWVWLSALIMCILYGIMFLVMRNVIVVGKNGINLAKKQRRVRPLIVTTDYEEEKACRELANVLLFYPAVYIICVLPNSISRWLYFSGRQVPFQVTHFTNALFAFSGFFNVILYFTTRRDYALGSSRPIISAQLPPTHHHRLLPSISPVSTATLTPSPLKDSTSQFDEIGLLSGQRQQKPSYQKWSPNSSTNNTYERVGLWHSRDSTYVAPSPTETTGGTTLCPPSPVEA